MPVQVVLYIGGVLTAQTALQRDRHERVRFGTVKDASLFVPSVAGSVLAGPWSSELVESVGVLEGCSKSLDKVDALCK